PGPPLFPSTTLFRSRGEALDSRSDSRQASAKPPPLTNQCIGVVQLAGSLGRFANLSRRGTGTGLLVRVMLAEQAPIGPLDLLRIDRKSTRLNSSHVK